MTDTLAETIQAPLKRLCDDTIDATGSDKRARVELDDTAHALERVQAVQDNIGKINRDYEERIGALQQSLVSELKSQYSARSPLLAAVPEFWKQTLRNAFRHYLTEQDHSVLDDLVEIEVDEPLLTHITVNLSFAEDSPYFADCAVTRSIVIRPDDQRSAHVQMEWKQTEEAASLQEDAATGGGAFCFFAWFVQPGDDLEDTFDSLLTQVWHDPLPYFNCQMEFPGMDGGEALPAGAQDAEFAEAGDALAVAEMQEELAEELYEEDDADLDEVEPEAFLEDDQQDEEEEEEEEEDDGDAL